MPNHCYNRVQISNDAEDNSKQFDELVAIFESQKPFSKIIPIPDYSKIPNEDGELPVRVEHKNEKAKCYLQHLNFQNQKKETIDGIGFVLTTGELSGKHTIFATMDIEEDSAEFCFNTAWGPADGIFDKIREDYPDVGISWFYDEPGCEIAGYLPN